ncbi:type II toxin-antitoxin system RelE/ParE family toxin [Pseudomonas alliivorans]|uniref:type II toxin-antitoxin system RelE/ParE family toxin n=2 Tax=Pseudomonas TaxID=286 RepID=UPI001AE4C3C8|nr:type II toxin-antitoxin system RelE/ParE family toxin [Pseudomonas alliivorans]MBP0940097.1 type II toxin-antitoxin system RelE/ParE family toxin [Pseudomonas alliivorans]MEE4877489.1 type II toxin-antitoxin system RelE/ParE family toxin [Pseudomonas alliivorans]MEE4929532.1 type II toxin-antitoxin system RelE/ParE family toxin [Pseudomonas alliivorans]MEE4934947.1 type II toxin-antitoxin system RelE/ParE family toxin [Pseudomonas alliivorans]MEE4940079.1 type II toxin-antitoxin system RelE
MIVSFKCGDTRGLFLHGKTRLWPALKAVAERKLAMLDAAVLLSDLRSPPGNRLEILEGDRRGQHSIRINIQFRICFVWGENGPENVEIVDYH